METIIIKLGFLFMVLFLGFLLGFIYAKSTKPKHFKSSKHAYGQTIKFGQEDQLTDVSETDFGKKVISLNG